MLSELESLGLDLVWLTTWGEDAPNSLGPVLGFGWDAPAPVTVPQTWAWSTMDWKFPGLQALEPEDRFVWIDDDIAGDEYFDNETVFRETFPHALLIAPDPRRGIEPKHIEQIREYINGD